MCNWYGNYGNRGPSYSCNQTGQVVISLAMFMSFTNITGFPSQSLNINIYYKEPFHDSEKCNWYGKDGNTGPEYSCNQTGQIVAIRRWDTEVLSVCSITVYGG